MNTIGVEPQTKKRIDPSLKTKLRPGELASLVKSWDLLEDRKRVLRMKPLPKSIDVTPKKKPVQMETFRE